MAGEVVLSALKVLLNRRNLGLLAIDMIGPICHGISRKGQVGQLS